MRPTIWRRAASRRDEARELHRRLGVHPVIAHVLLNRGVDDIEAFLDPDGEPGAELSLLADLDRAAERLEQAVRQRQRVVIYGDYDADGCCAGALLARFLRGHGVPHQYYVPDRFEEGYGVNAAALLGLLTGHKPDLLVTVDCGIGSAEEIDTAVALGCDVIVTDHHQVPERLPRVPAVNPHRADCAYPFKEICGATVAYKLCQRVTERLGGDLAELEAELIELVAIGTVADVMPLLGENRRLVQRGLRALGRTRSPGLKALLETAGLGRDGVVSARDIGFGIGPRLNAAGRLESADMAYRLLVTEDNHEAWELAGTLERLNRERREIEARTTDEALRLMDAVSLHETWGVVVAGEGWHEGVVGLVAGRLCRRYCRPVLALSLNGETAKGSGRSTEAVDLHAALTRCADLLTAFGGHPRAAGFSLPQAAVPALSERFNAAVKEQITEAELAPVIDLECSLKASAITLELARELARLAPFGEGHPEPLLEVKGLRLTEARATRDGTHLQLRFAVADDGGRELKGFWPRMGRVAGQLRPGAAAIVAGALTIDTWGGREQPQLLVTDLQLQAD